MHFILFSHRFSPGSAFLCMNVCMCGLLLKALRAQVTHTHTIEICLYGTVYCKSTALQCKLTDVEIKSNIVQVQLTVFIVYEFLTHSSS